MFKYEEEANKRIAEKDWAHAYAVWKEFDIDEANIKRLVKSEFLSGQSPLLRNSFDRNYRVTERGIERYQRDPRQPWESVPPINMSCAVSSCNRTGLYFVGMIGVTPDEKKYFLVKVGEADGRSVASRIGDYATYNPMIYHNDCFLMSNEYDSCNSDGETNCQWYIAERAYGRGQNSHEWFYVDEETYYELCNTFSDKEMFKAIAEGRD